MFNQDLLAVLEKARGINPLLARNMVKEEIQNYILNFVYQDSLYQNLISTGGTCLRKLYGLDRLSEDLDFDYSFDFDIYKFAAKLKKYFVSKLQYKNVKMKISGNKQTLFIKFEENDILVRCDFSKVNTMIFSLNKGLITAGKYKFLVNAYDLETMFANKITAFLKRNFFKGKFQTIPFKGRDIYDLFWLLQLSAKNGYNLKPNKKRLQELTGTDTATLKEEIKKKIKMVDSKFVYDDLLPLVETDEFLREFIKIFDTTIIKQIDMVL